MNSDYQGTIKKAIWSKNCNSCGCAIWIAGPETSDMFARSCCRSLKPILWRIPILLWAIGTITWSFTSFWGPKYLWPLYMTHWGLILILLQSFLGVIVAIAHYRERLPDSSYPLPYYVKTYWVLYNTAIPVAFLISMFYWLVLKGSNVPSLPKVLDYFIHALNSGVMLFELLMSAHPSRMLHIYQPLSLGLSYLLFGVAYYYAGGLDPFGNVWIYPVIDWSKPRETAVVVALTALYLALMHIVVVIIASIRDAIEKRLRSNTSTEYYDCYV